MSQEQEATTISNPTDEDMTEIKSFRPKYEDIVSMDIMDGLKEFCDEFSCIIVPPSDQEIKNTSRIKDDNNDDSSATLLLLESLNNLISELSDNLNKSIVRIEELQSAKNSFKNSMSLCGEAIMNNLEIRINEMNKIYNEIDIINELILIIEIEYINKYKERYNDILVLCDQNFMIQKQLKKDPIGTIKKQYKKTIKQNKPKIKNEINVQKQKLKKIKNNLQFSAKNVFTKLKQNQNIFAKAKDITTQKTTNDLKIENDEYKQKNIDKTQIINKNENENENENKINDINYYQDEYEDEDQIKAINEYKWNQLPKLPNWDMLIQYSKEKSNARKNIQNDNKNINVNKNNNNNNNNDIKIKWLSDEKNDNNKNNNKQEENKNELDKNNENNNNENDDESQLNKSEKHIDLP